MKKQLLLLILTLSSLAILRGQPITVETLVAPPYAANVSDYLDQNVLKITNSSNVPISIMLKGTLVSDNGITGRTKDTYKPSRPIVVPPNNQPVILQATKQNRVDFFDTKNVEYNTGVYSLPDIIRTGIVPEGNYTICITAHDYTTGGLISKTDGGINCRVFNIIIPQPPTIDCDANVPMLNGIQSLAVGAALPSGVAPQPVSINFSWLPTNANGRALIVAYDLYLLKLDAGQNGADALLAAIRLKQNNAIKFENIRTPQYNAILATTPSLVAGKYAWAVVAKDGGGGNTPFQNNGISQVCEFEWKAVAPPPPPNGGGNQLPRVVVTEPKCNCDLIAPEGVPSTDALKTGDLIKIGAYTLRVNSAQTDPTGGWKGTGNIKLPLIGAKIIPMLVDFEKLTFIKTGNEKEAKTGVAYAQKHPGAPSLNAKVQFPDMPTLLPVNASDIEHFDDYFKANRDHTMSAMEENVNNSGVTLPFGLDDPNRVTIGIVNMTFTPIKAWFDAIAGMEVTESSGNDPKWIAFGASGVCMRPATGEGLCGDAKLYLAEDLAIKRFKLVGAKGGKLEDGCYLLIEKSKVEAAHFVGEYAFPQTELTRADGKNEDVKVRLTFSATSWSNWLATATIPDFKIKGVKDFVFRPDKAFYDHTDVENPKGLPTDYTEGSKPQWHGFFIPELKVELPPVLKKNDNSPIEVGIKNFIVDDKGVTGRIFAENVVSLQNGNMDGWGFSLDKINVEFLKSAFVKGNMNGKILLPLAKDNTQSELDYTGLLTYQAKEKDMDKEIDYKFNVQPKANIEVPMWAAKLTINDNSRITVSNQNKEAKFHAEAHLYGDISINTHDVDKSLPNFNLVGLKFENIYLKNFKDDKNPKDDYFGVDKTEFVSGFASPPKSAGGFPLAITSFAYAPTQGENATFKIGFKLKICDISVLPEATADLMLRGNIGLDNGKLTPQYKGIKPTQITLLGNIGPVHIDGKLSFFEGDGVYGNGIYGRLTADMLPEDDPAKPPYKMNLGRVAAQFGSKDGRNYWFVDAMTGAGLDNLIPGVKIKALGGGAYYNMTADGQPDRKALSLVLPVANGGVGDMALGVSASGSKYTPKFDGTLGFKAVTYFAIGDENVFNADAFIGIEFANTGGVSRFMFKGSARYLETSRGAAPLAYGGLEVDYNVTKKIFAISISASSNKLPIKEANMHLYFSPQGWHIKLGQPAANGKPIKFTLVPGVIDADAYFQVGNYLVDASPDLPPRVVEMLKATGVNTDQLKSNRSKDAMNQGTAIAFGAGISLQKKGDLGIIYGSLEALAGFDLSLQKRAEFCDDNPTNLIGIDGWYATGQFYAGIEAVLGVKIDLGICHAEVEILKGTAAAAIRGGGPNPFWGKGAMGIKVSILGIINGQLHYQFSIGSPCKTMSDNEGVESIKIISAIKPESGQIDIDETLATAFNYKVGRRFSIDQHDENGNVKGTRYFGFEKTNIKITLKNLKTKNTVNVNRIFPTNDANALILQPTDLLQPETDFELALEASLTEYLNVNDANGRIAKKQNGDDFKEIKTVSFRTNKGLDAIKPESISNVNPVFNQRYFIKGDAPTGFIETNQGYTFDKFNIPDIENKTLSAVARFVKMNGQADVQPSPESPITINGNRWEFNLPALAPSQIYVAQLIVRWKNNSGFDESSSVLSKTIQRKVLKKYDENTANSNYEVTEQTLNSDKLRASGNEKIVFSINFKSSRYNTYADKLQAMKFREMWIATINPERDARIWLNDEQANVPINIVEKARQAFNIPNNATAQLLPIEFNFATAENFDKVDIDGYRIPTNQLNQGSFLEPRVSFKNEAYERWADKIYEDVYKALKDGGVGMNATYVGARKAGDYVPYISAKQDIITYPDPILTDNEVKGLAGPRLEGLLEFRNGQLKPRAMLTMSYEYSKGYIPPQQTNQLFGNLRWSINPSANQLTGIGNAFDAGAIASQAPVGGMNMGLNGGGKSFNFNVSAR
jgi:hypothetical protein